MAVKKGLGKGLDSLITDKVNTKPAASKNNPTPKSEHAADAIMMNITKVEPNREQPRKKFDEDALLELAESIKQYGVFSHFWYRRGRIIMRLSPGSAGGEPQK